MTVVDQDGGLLELHRAFVEAELRADTRRLTALLADDFVSIGDAGFQLDKRQWIGRHEDFSYLALEVSEVDVRAYERVAIVRCLQRSRGRWRGEVFESVVRVGQTWVELPEGWRLAGIQFSPWGG